LIFHLFLLSNHFISGKTGAIQAHIEALRGKAAKQGVCDRGYRGESEVNGMQIILPEKTLKKDTRYPKDKKRK